MLAEKILVVDDDPRVAQSLKMLFPEYEFVDFLDGLSALEFLKTNKDICLGLLDFKMSGMDGLSLVKHIKKINPEMSLILMTAFGSMGLVVEALRYNMDDYIEKPFDYADTKEKISSILKDKIAFHRVHKNPENLAKRMKTFIRQNPDQATLAKIGEEMCLSPKYVSQIFRQQSQVSFRRYKLQVKMEKARGLLKDLNRSVNDIAFELGYQNPETFMRLFKKFTQMTPTEYRNSLIQKTPS